MANSDDIVSFHMKKAGIGSAYLLLGFGSLLGLEKLARNYTKPFEASPFEASPFEASPSPSTLPTIPPSTSHHTEETEEEKTLDEHSVPVNGGQANKMVSIGLVISFFIALTMLILGMNIHPHGTEHIPENVSTLLSQKKQHELSKAVSVSEVLILSIISGALVVAMFSMIIRAVYLSVKDQPSEGAEWVKKPMFWPFWLAFSVGWLGLGVAGGAKNRILSSIQTVRIIMSMLGVLLMVASFFLVHVQQENVWLQKGKYVMFILGAALHISAFSMVSHHE
jgi:hypothetical protein